MKLVILLYDQTGSGKSKMMASKPEIPMSLLPGEIETKFQRLYSCIQGQATRKTGKNYDGPLGLLEIKDGGHYQK